MTNITVDLSDVEEQVEEPFCEICEHPMDEFSNRNGLTLGRCEFCGEVKYKGTDY